MADTDGPAYEAPMLLVLGRLEELTEGIPLLTSADIALFYRGF